MRGKQAQHSGHPDTRGSILQSRVSEQKYYRETSEALQRICVCRYSDQCMHERRVTKVAQSVTQKIQFSSVQPRSCVRLFATPWTAARPPCPSPTLRVYSNSCPFESVMPSSHLILCCPLLLPPSTFPSIRVFSNESVLHIRWPKYWSFSFSIRPSNEY